MIRSQKSTRKKTIAILTTCVDEWGGCEELWFRSIPHLKEAGYDIQLYKDDFNAANPFIKVLLNEEIALRKLRPSLRLDKRAKKTLAFVFKKINNPFHSVDHSVQNFTKKLSKDKPSLVIISQAINFDGLKYAYECLKLNIPYVIVSHKAVDFYWPSVQDKMYMRKTLKEARLCCYVSRHNLRLTEDQFGIRLKNSKIVFNPIKVERKILRYPSVDKGIRLACLGRFFLIDKGQDILISVLSQKKWRERPITVALMGSGPDRVNIEEMINLHQITSITILPYNSNLKEIWLDYHALILPSRSEGLPLAIIEAMAVGRPVITTNAGGSAELIEDGSTGFVGEANERSLDDALERAWQNRARWESMGIDASIFVQNNIPENPEENFAKLLINII